MEWRSLGPVLTEGDLLETSLRGTVGWFDPDEEHIPLDMFARGGGASARKGLIQQHEVGHLIDLREKPVGKMTTAGAGNLIAQQLDRAIQDPMVVRFDKAILAMIGKPNHARIFDGLPEPRMGLQEHSSSLLSVGSDTPRKIVVAYFSEK